MRISDWSSDVCSSDLSASEPDGPRTIMLTNDLLPGIAGIDRSKLCDCDFLTWGYWAADADRKSVVWGKSVSVRVDLGGRRIIKKKKQIITDHCIHLP